MLKPRIAVAVATLATLAAVVLLVATSGSDDDAAPMTTAATTADRAEGEGGKAGEGRGVEKDEDRGDEDEDRGGDEGVGSPDGSDDSDDADSQSGQPASVSSDGNFGAQLRAIVGASLAELAPLAQGTAAAGDPSRYSQMLATGVDQIDATIGEIEALDPPPEAEAGTRTLLDAYADLRDDLSRGAKDFSTGKSARVQSALTYLAQAAADFRGGVANATQSLAAAGFNTGVR